MGSKACGGRQGPAERSARLTCPLLSLGPLIFRCSTLHGDAVSSLDTGQGLGRTWTFGHRLCLLKLWVVPVSLQSVESSSFPNNSQLCE